MCIIQKLICAELDFNEQVKILETIAPAAFFMYINANWLNCIDMWGHYPRLTIPTFGTNTVNPFNFAAIKFCVFNRLKFHCFKNLRILIFAFL